MKVGGYCKLPQRVGRRKGECSGAMAQPGGSHEAVAVD